MYVKLIAATQLQTDFHEVCERVGYEPYASLEEEDYKPASVLAEFAGRLCYKSWNRPNPATATNAGYIANIKEHKHFSVLEHGSVSFYFDGISRNLTHELVRHRHFSFSQVSQRYVDDYESEVVIPDAIVDLLREELFADTVDQLRGAKELYRTFVRKLRDKGVPKKKAQQAARFILPGATETAIVVSGNHRSWSEFVDKRYSEFADPEIRELAGIVLQQLKALEPNIYADFEEKEF